MYYHYSACDHFICTADVSIEIVLSSAAAFSGSISSYLYILSFKEITHKYKTIDNLIKPIIINDVKHL